MFLLAEDDHHDAFFVEQEFKGVHNLQLRRVCDGVEAMEYVEGKGVYGDRDKYPLPDVVLLDLKMPRVDGFGFLEWLRCDAPEKTRTIPVVVLSSSAEEKDINRAQTLGASSYVVKPSNAYKFKERIKELGTYWDEHIRQHKPS